MFKPDNLTNVNLPSLSIHKRERYLPTAFDESLSILEKINKVVQYLHEYADLTEQMLIKWNEVYEWVMNEGLDTTIGNRLYEWLEDGTFDTIINKTIFNELNTKINDMQGEISTFIVEVNGIITTLKNDIDEKMNTLKTDINNQFDSLKNEINEEVFWTGKVEIIRGDV